MSLYRVTSHLSIHTIRIARSAVDHHAFRDHNKHYFAPAPTSEEIFGRMIDVIVCERRDEVVAVIVALCRKMHVSNSLRSSLHLAAQLPGQENWSSGTSWESITKLLRETRKADVIMERISS